MTFRMGENKTNLFCVYKEEHQRSMHNAKAIPGKFQHALVIADIDKRKIRNVVRKTSAERRKM